MTITKQIILTTLAATLSVSSAFANLIALDFVSGVYSKQQTWSSGNNQYQQDGFTVKTVSAVDIFSSSGAPLGWYDGLTEIIIESSTVGPFDLNSLNVVYKSFAGLTFTSSKGTVVSIGSVAGALVFNDAGWKNIDYFTVKKSSNFNILTAINNISLTTKPVNVFESSSIILLSIGLFGLMSSRKKYSKA